ncbi:thaumatin domain-containing protein [Legionella moravica]|uniref:Endo-1,3-beta-glucanase btgC n=1 Tax=Legionella moravica TaxID=39962 RepID=A0A378JVA0_9GAMM|nr:glycosyl hydrolase family 17 protein [Legionella moravica]KTD34721.1 thaumatin domain-containing protein [Legionella moravica]STX61328.1 thaumatin domain-containing protein [Legionella moravica]
MNQTGIVCAFFLMINQVCADNPIVYTLDAPFPAQVSTIGGSVTATYTFTNNLPFTFKKPFQVSAKLCPAFSEGCTASANEFTFVDQCSGKKLQPGEHCTYSVSLSAKTTGQKTVQVSYGGYDNNVVTIRPPLTTNAQSTSAGVLGTINYPSANPLPSRGFTNTDYTVTFTFTNFAASEVRFTQRILQNNDPLHPNFLITSNTCSPSGTTGTLASGAQCQITGTFNSASNGLFSLSAELIGTISSNRLTTSTNVQAPSFNQLIGVDYNPNHYTNSYPFNFHDVFYTGTLNNPAATNVYAELQQLQNAGFTTVRSYQTEPYSWIDIIKQAHALGMQVIYEAVIPQLPSDTNYPGCPVGVGALNYIPCAQQTLQAVVNEVTPAVFESTVSLVFAGHENYCEAGNTIAPCNNPVVSNIGYLTSAVMDLQTTIAGLGLSTPVSSALISGNLVTPSSAISADMQTLITQYSANAPLGFDPYPFQWGVSPANAGVWTPPLSTTSQPTNSLAWDYIQVVGSANPPALPAAPGQPFYTPGRVLLMAETGWATAGTTNGYACNSPGPCAPSVANATTYFQTLYQMNTSNFVNTSGYSNGVLAFEAYDEPAKPGPTAEQNYGLFDSNCNQKAAGLVPNNAMVSATGCQGYINGTLLTINGTIPPSPQPAFNVQISYPSGQHPNINVTIPANNGTAPNISTVTPWPQFLIYQGANIKVTSTTSSQVCTTTATAVTALPASITFSPVVCSTTTSSMGCFGLGCQISNPY